MAFSIIRLSFLKKIFAIFGLWGLKPWSRQIFSVKNFHWKMFPIWWMSVWDAAIASFDSRVANCDVQWRAFCQSIRSDAGDGENGNYPPADSSVSEFADRPTRTTQSRTSKNGKGQSRIAKDSKRQSRKAKDSKELQRTGNCFKMPKLMVALDISS